jgi:hypothetical protein
MFCSRGKLGTIYIAGQTMGETKIFGNNTYLKLPFYIKYTAVYQKVKNTL